MPGSTPTLTTLVSFNGFDGEYPDTNLVLGTDGTLYGTVPLFTFYLPDSMATDALQASFQIKNLGGGAYAATSQIGYIFPNGFATPVFGMTIDPSGNLYGTGQLPGGGEALFGSLNPAVGGEEFVFQYQPVVESPTNGPWSNLTVDAAGHIFMTNRTGGSNGDGAVIEITPTPALTPATASPISASPATVTTVVSFDGTDGKFVNPGLIADANGDLFGTASNGGGAGAFGTLFEIVHTAAGYASTPTVLTTFTTATGLVPAGGLTIDAAGDIYGFTSIGTPNGSVFELVKTGGVYASTPITLVSGLANASVNRSLIVDGAGNLFGTTSAGGTSGLGTVFEIVKGSGALTTLLNFNGTNGAMPRAGLTADANGNLFGDTTIGGTSNLGTAFEIANSGYEVACFCPNTQIMTPDGKVAVETLRAGDVVTTASGRHRRLTWVGQGHALATRGQRGAATPIIVRKGALADNVPNYDLRITKGHSLFIDGVLIPAEFLVNHRSILWDDRAQEVTVYHLELETHDVLLANGAPAESYRDDGNRWLFSNGNTGWDQPPKPPCAPVLTGGPVVDAIWRRLLDRSGTGGRLPMTSDPDLHLMVDGRRLDASAGADGAFVFTLPERPGAVRIVSRSAVPQELGFARDPRPLGVALRRLVVRQGTASHAIEADDPCLVEGFHTFEPDNGFVWTDGDAALPAGLLDGFTGPMEVVLAVGCTSRYVDEGDRLTLAAAA